MPRIVFGPYDVIIASACREPKKGYDLPIAPLGPGLQPPLDEIQSGTMAGVASSS
jgi:hypothetical protein